MGPRVALYLQTKCREGLTIKELAARFGVKASTVKNALIRGYAELEVSGEAQACYVCGLKERERLMGDADAAVRAEAV